MYSEEAEAKAEKAAALEEEREERGLKLRDTKSRVKKYDRLKKKTRTKGVQDKKLRHMLKASDTQAQKAARKAARSELLLHEEPGYLEAEGLEKTFKFKQEDIAAAVPLASALQYFDLSLDTFGPYSVNFSMNGRQLLLGGNKGHLATLDWRQKKLGCEFHVRETIRDVKYLHNEMMFAVAQKRFLYVYDHSGMELHCLKQHRDVNRLTYLPYHFLLVSANDHGGLHYLDTSTGRPVAEHRTKMGSLRCMTNNPYNGIVHLGHQNGTVTLWSPNMHTPLVKMLCHRGPITDVAVESGGWYMATAAMDATLKIWDIRNYKELNKYTTYRPAVSLSVSQRGMLALGRGRVVEVWKDVMGRGEKQKAPYMSYTLKGEVSKVEFCPFEDCLGIGHRSGFTSIIVPGAGEANFDALEVNPFQTKKQRQEGEVKQLLEKIPSELITLDPDQIRRVNPKPADNKEKECQKEAGKVKNKARGKSTLTKKRTRKQGQKDHAVRNLRREQLEAKKKVTKETVSVGSQDVLDRFR